MKSGLDYFPLDCQMDDSVKLIEAQFGLAGFAAIIKLWQDIYRGEGYYKKFNNDVKILFAKELGVDTCFLNDVINAALDREIFNRELFDKFEILTSKGIQKRFLTIARKRKNNSIISEFDLITKEASVQTKEISVQNEQSKVKESKGKESKGNEEQVKTTENDSLVWDLNAFSSSSEKNLKSLRDSALTPLGEYKNVYLTDAQRQALIKKLGEADFKEYVRRLDEYIQETGKRYNNHSVTILKWHREDKEKEKEKTIRARAPAVEVKKSKFNNYTDTNEKNYEKIKEAILNEFMED